MGRLPLAVALAAALAAVAFLMAGGPSGGEGAPARPGSSDAAGAGSRAILPDEAWGVLAGSVVDAGGAPVPGARVLADDGRGFGGSAETGPAGEFRLVLESLATTRRPFPAPRAWAGEIPVATAVLRVRVEAGGFVGSQEARVEVARGETRVLDPLVAWRGGRVRGRVRDLGTGEEVAATVDARLGEGRAAGERVLSLPGSGFELGPLPPGPVTVRATRGGGGFGARDVEVEEGGTADLEISLERPAVAIVGRVVDTSSGQGVDGVRVLCLRMPEQGEGNLPPRQDPDSPHMGRGNRARRTSEALARERDDPAWLRAQGLAEATTVDGGWFVIPDARAGRDHQVFVAGAGVLPGAGVDGVRPGPEDVLLRMPPRLAVSGTVHDAATRSPIASATVHAIPPRARARYRMGALDAPSDLPRSGSDGGFTVPDLFPGEHVLLVSAPGYEVAEVSVTVSPEADRAAPRAIALRRAAAVEGTVRGPDGTPLPGALVTIEPAASQGADPPSAVAWYGRVETRSDSNGRFLVEDLPGDRPFLLRVSGPGGESGHGEVRTAPGAATLHDLALVAPAELLVTVRPRGRGTLRGHPVRVRGAGARAFDLLARTDDAGRVRVVHLEPGRYHVAAVDPREDTTRAEARARMRDVSLVAGQASEVVIEVEDVVEVTGTVRIGAVAPPVARVGFGPLRGTPDTFAPLLFDLVDGGFSGRMPPGRYHVHVAVPGRRHEIAEPVVVPSEPAHRLRIDVSPP